MWGRVERSGTSAWPFPSSDWVQKSRGRGDGEKRQPLIRAGMVERLPPELAHRVSEISCDSKATFAFVAQG